MKKFLTIFAVAALALTAVVSCSKDKEDEETTVELKGISLSSSSLDLFVGDENTLTVKYTPENATEKPKATWTSSNAEVASVSEGKVTALAAGETTITAKVLTFTATCTVKVSAKDDYTGPVEGTSAWSVVGTLLESGWGSGAHGDYVCAEDNGAFVLKNVRLAENDELKFRKDKAWDVNRGVAAIELGVPVKAEQDGGNIKLGQAGLFDLYYFAEKEAIVIVAKDGTLPEIPDFSEPVNNDPVKVDGDPAEWASLNAENVVSLELPADAAMTGLKSAKLYYADKLYVLVEISDEAIADGKVRLHIYFDTDKTGALAQNWTNGTIDYMTEGKITNAGAFVSYSSTLYKWNGTAENPWAWAESGWTPTCEGAGEGSIYELSLDYDGFPGGLPVAFNIGLDVVNSSWATFGFLPNAGEASKLARIVKVGATDPGEEPEEPQVDWDYTPSAEYTAENNLWKAVDAAHTLEWYYNPDWAGEQEAPATKFDQSTYEIWNKVATSGDWQAQMWIHPTNELLLDATKKYSFSCKVYATEETPIFLKLYQKGEDGSRSFEIARTRLPKGQITELKAEDFTPIITPQCLLIDFGGIPANTKVFVKDIVLTEGDAVTPPQPMDWDYTPSDAFNASTNLWKVADGNEMYYYYHCTSADWNGQDTISAEVPFMTKTQSTYELTYEEATANPWQNQFFIFPGEGHFVALQADKTYKISFTLAANADMFAFANLKTYDASNAKREGATIHEWGGMNLKAKESVVIEHEFTGVAADNIILIFDFGGNPAGAKVFIKDITITAQGGEVPPTPGAITIDGNFDDWANIAGLGNGTYGMLKIAVDDNNLYMYSLRTKEGRYSEIWGSKAGYIYLGLNLDGDETTGVSLWGNGPYEFVGVLYPYGATEGTFVETPGDACMPETATLANAKAAGAVTEAGAIVEISIPLADLPALPAEFDVVSWGNKDLAKVKMHYPYVPAPATIAEIIEKIPADATGSSTAVEFEANLTSPAVVSYVNGKNAYIQDATGAILLFLADHGLAAGDTIKGKIAIKAYWYNGIPETVVALGDAAEIAHGDAPAPKEMTIAQLLDNYDANLLRLVKFTDVTVTDGIADGDRNGAIAQDGATIAVYAQINNGGLVLEAGAKGDFVTIPAYYKTNKQVYLWDNAWFTKAPQGSTGEDLGGSDDVNPWN